MSILSTITDISQMIQRHNQLEHEKNKLTQELQNQREIAKQANEVTREVAALRRSTDEGIAKGKLDAEASQRDLDRRNKTATSMISGVGQTAGGLLGGRALGVYLGNKMNPAYTAQRNLNKIFQTTGASGKTVGTTLKSVGGKMLKTASKSIPAAALTAATLTLTKSDRQPVYHSVDDAKFKKDLDDYVDIENALRAGKIPYKQRGDFETRLENLKTKLWTDESRPSHTIPNRMVDAAYRKLVQSKVSKRI